jgi:hypothetical protein
MYQINTEEVAKAMIRKRTARLARLLKMFKGMTPTQQELTFCGLLGMADCVGDDEKYELLVDEMKNIKGLSL